MIIRKKKNLQLILGLFTHEMHNIMLNTSIGSFLFGVVMMLKATLSSVQALRSKTVSYPLTDSCPMALDIKGKLQMCDYTSPSHVLLMEVSDCKSIVIQLWVLLLFPLESSLCTYNKIIFTYAWGLNRDVTCRIGR